MKKVPLLGGCFCLLVTSPPVGAYIGLGPLLPVFGGALIYIFVVLIAVIGVLGYPIKRLFDRFRTHNGEAGTNKTATTQKEIHVKSNSKFRQRLTIIIAALLDYLANLENLILRRRLQTTIDRPIFICGLARSNTTLLTHILNLHFDTGSFLYRDLPFPSIPYLWSFFNASYYKGKLVEQRIHRDALKVDPNSPDAFEEIIWKTQLPDYFDGSFCAILDDSYNNSLLEDALRKGIRKILVVRKKKTRYISKGNYNLFRLKFILKIFPDAKLILCIRDPIKQARSMTRVHQEFMRLAAKDRSFVKKLNNLGHFEFGPNRKAVTVNPEGCELTETYWNDGDDYRGYLQQWIDVYSFVLDCYLEGRLARRNLLLADYGTFTKDANSEISRIADFCQLETTDSFLETAVEKVTASSADEAPSEFSRQENLARQIHSKILNL